MSSASTTLSSRAERFHPSPSQSLQVRVGDVMGTIADISRSGLACTLAVEHDTFRPGTKLHSLRIQCADSETDWGPASIVRSAPVTGSPSEHHTLLGLAFRTERPELLTTLKPHLVPYEYVTHELATDTRRPPRPGADPTNATLDQFYAEDSPDLFAKCRTFGRWVDDMMEYQLYQRFYRVTLTGPIDHRVTAFDPLQRCERVLHGFDSNSYLNLHQHPKVVEAVLRVTRQVGFGTPSAQLLCGTNRHLRELEQALCEFHGRQAAMVFPSGFAANAGAIRALLRSNDMVVRDQFAHASIHEACRNAGARITKVFAHNRPESLANVLRRGDKAGVAGKLVVTDGVFSMHGRIAPLPDLVQVCREHGAHLMIDDAHGVGVLGATGRGIEEHFGMPGSVDVLMGTLSKALGSVGGYVCGDEDMITYLRWFAPSGLFTTSLPAPLCAGIKAALEVIVSEPEHRVRLWENIRYFVPAIRDAGFIVPPAESPIVTMYIGRQKLLWDVSRELFDAGIKCGNVIYPAVGKNDCILRFTLSSAHDRSDLDFAIDTLTRIGKRFGILGRSKKELQELGRQPRLGDAPLPHAS